jgi:serine-type D-Ala-D-Ala carboxypeptidase (penicillin-binding protein 5/6)
MHYALSVGMRIFARLLIICMAAALGLAQGALAAAWPEPPRIAAPSWILADATTGQTLASANADAPIDPASLTKLMVVYLSFTALRERRLRLEQGVPSPAESEIPPGSRMFLTTSNEATVSELLRGLIVVGANDAAIALSKAISGSEQSFVELMNKTAEKLGMGETRFLNATGRQQSGQRSSVRDIARLAEALINEFPEQLREFGRREFTYNSIRQLNRNRLLWLDNSVDGLITTRTESEGYGIAISARRPQPLGPKERIQRRLIAVIAGATTEEARSQEGLKLLNFGFQQFDVLRLFRANEVSFQVPVYRGVVPSTRIHFPRDVLVAIPRGQAAEVRTELERPTALLAPLYAGQMVGELKIWLGDKEIHRVPMAIAEPVKPAGLFGRAVDTLRLWWKSITK